MSKGLTGDAPEWYVILRASRYLRVPPWDLLEQPVFWLEVALAAEDAESRAADQESKRASKAQKGK